MSFHMTEFIQLFGLGLFWKTIWTLLLSQVTGEWGYKMRIWYRLLLKFIFCTAAGQSLPFRRSFILYQVTVVVMAKILTEKISRILVLLWEKSAMGSSRDCCWEQGVGNQFYSRFPGGAWVGMLKVLQSDEGNEWGECRTVIQGTPEYETYGDTHWN